MIQYKLNHRHSRYLLALLLLASSSISIAARTTCYTRTMMLDLDGDTVKESYQMVSLLDCNKQNLVSSIKSQRGGTCGTMLKQEFIPYQTLSTTLSN